MKITHTTEALEVVEQPVVKATVTLELTESEREFLNTFLSFDLTVPRILSNELPKAGLSLSSQDECVIGDLMISLRRAINGK